MYTTRFRIPRNLAPLAMATAALSISGSAAAQDSTATIAVTVKGSDGKVIESAAIASPGKPSCVTSADGHCEVRGILPGTVAMRALFIGYDRVDTTFTLRAGERATWRVVMKKSAFWARMEEEERAAFAANEKAEAAHQAAGGLDSLAAGKFKTDTSAAFSFERFGLTLLNAAVAMTPPESSRVLSPLSAGEAFGIALGAAKDSTAIVVSRMLGLGALTADQLADRDRRFRLASSKRTDITLRIANALWVDRDEQLQPTFQRWATDRYGASVDVAKLNKPEIVQLLNHWADSMTSGLIKKVLAKPLPDSTVTVLANAVYFKGAWLDEFNVVNTKPRPFTFGTGARADVPTMERTAYLAYRRGSNWQALRIPYRFGLAAMYVVLPDTGVSARSVLADMAKGAWPVPDPVRDQREVHVQLPKVHVTQSTDLKAVMRWMGVKIPFDSERGDFGGLIVQKPTRPPPCPPLSSGVRSDACTRVIINHATQHVFLDVDEQGTTAAAVTVVGFQVVPTSAPPPPIPFIVNRPFLFALRDERTGVLMFVGYIADPTK